MYTADYIKYGRVISNNEYGSVVYDINCPSALVCPKTSGLAVAKARLLRLEFAVDRAERIRKHFEILWKTDTFEDFPENMGESILSCCFCWSDTMIPPYTKIYQACMLLFHPTKVTDLDEFAIGITC